MRFALWFGLCVILVGPATLHAQASDASQPVELVGLHQWTRQMIKDSLAKNVPGSDTTLSTHACGAEILQLGFLRTAAVYYPTRIVVSVVEPQDSARVRSLVVATARPLPSAWQGALSPFLDATGRLTNGLIPLGIKLYPMILAGKRDSLRAVLTASSSTIPPPLDSLWDFMLAHRSDADRREALETLASDSVVAHRTFALAILANFSQDDVVWRALLHTLRERNDVPGVWNTAQAMLVRWSKATPIKVVDWAPSHEDLRALFSGANLWALPDLMRILTATKIDPAVGRSVLAGNDVFVRGYARSRDSQAAAEGQRLLTQVHLPLADAVAP